MTEDIEKNTDKNGIINSNGYTFWNRAEIVRPYITKYLKSKFKNSLIICEINRIDIVVLGENIPVEIQSTNVRRNSSRSVWKNNYQLSHAEFEDRIRRQIEDNIENYGKCWFFFDSEYYRYLNNSEMLQISTNLDWFAKYVKENKLKVFTIKYDGTINELSYKDLSFIRKHSNTCKVEYINDERELNRNKLNIISNVLKCHKFVQDEIDDIMNNYDKRKNQEIDLREFLSQENDKRTNLYGDILRSISALPIINDILDMNSYYNRTGKHWGSVLGIFEFDKHKHMRFIDKHNICKYFPGYLRNKETWDKIKDGHFTDNQLREIFTTKNSNNQKDLSNY